MRLVKSRERGGMKMVKTRITEWNTTDKLLMIQGWARDGLTNQQIAHNMGIHHDTLHRWSKKDKSIYDALKKGKEVVDREVENALFKRAVGYKYTEEQVTNDGRIVEVEKYMRPDTTAQIFWLKNRKREQWRDKQDYHHQANVNTSLDLSNISDNDLRQLANRSQKGRS